MGPPTSHFPQGPTACPSPVLWGCSWLPQGFFSRVPGLAGGLTASGGALFLRRLLLSGAAPPRRPGQHAASERRAGQHLYAGTLCCPGLLPCPPCPLPSSQAVPASLSGQFYLVGLCGLRSPAHLTRPRLNAGAQRVSGPRGARSRRGSRGCPLAAGSGRGAAFSRVCKGDAEQKSLHNLDMDVEATPSPQGNAQHGFRSQTHTHTHTHTLEPQLRDLLASLLHLTQHPAPIFHPGLSTTPRGSQVPCWAGLLQSPRAKGCLRNRARPEAALTSPC